MLQAKIKLPTLYPQQKDIAEDTHRFRVLDCGRRWGKSVLAMVVAYEMLAEKYNQTHKKARGWVVAPTFPLVREDWLLAEELLKDFIQTKQQTAMRIDFKWIGSLEFKSAERDDEGLRGAGLDCAVIDEASRVSRKSWEQGIRPSLADKQGRTIFISTPKGRNWFYELWLQGQEENNQIKSWKYSTDTNPYFPKNEWQTILQTTPEMILKQEYMGDFLEDEATVFKNLSKCYRGEFELPDDKEYYTIGIDLGKSEDFTVISVIKNSTRQLVDLYRHNKIDWSLQKEFICGVCKRFKKHIAIIDSTGLGDPIADDLRKMGINIQDYKFTNTSKEALVNKLIIAIEQGLVGIPNINETQFLINELKSFTYEILPSGKLRYTAPDGLHDDGVISFGLAVSGISHLIYNKPKTKKETKWGTANDWDNLYKEMGYLPGHNMSSEYAINRLRQKRFQEALR